MNNLDHSYVLQLNTEPTVEQLVEGHEKSTVLDLSKRGLKKVPKLDDVDHVKELNMDENLLQKIDNIESFLKIEKVHAAVSRSNEIIFKHTYFNLNSFRASI